jgi:hypothetical protein
MNSMLRQIVGPRARFERIPSKYWGYGQGSNRFHPYN